jgi:hypothetical protein
MNLSERTIAELGGGKILITALSVTVIIFLAAGGFIYSQIDVEGSQTSFNVNATILSEEQNDSLKAGIATGEGISFGKFSNVFNKTKTLNLSANQLTMVEIDSTGNISDKLRFDDEKLFNGGTKIPVEMSVNQSGYYEGNLYLDLRTAQNKWGERWLRLAYNYF